MILLTLLEHSAFYIMECLQITINLKGLQNIIFFSVCFDRKNCLLQVLLELKNETLLIFKWVKKMSAEYEVYL